MVLLPISFVLCHTICFLHNNIRTHFKNLVKTGDVVKAGHPIGLTGRTGRATTEHVHFETRINGQHFNPNLIFDLKERTLRKERIKCTKNGSKIFVKTHTPDSRIAQSKK